MIFNAPSFFIYFSALLFCFAIAPGKWRPYVLLAGSLLWYSAWSPLWLVLLIGLSAIDYWGSRRKVVEILGRNFVFGSLIAFNLAFLLFFRNLPELLEFFSAPQNSLLYRFAAPFGINFYVFLAMSYLIDRWRGAEEQETFPEFLLYVSFFAIVTAGPMERFRHLLTQFRRLGPLKRQNLFDGIMIFSWGFFKKMAIADSLRHPVRAIFFSPNVGVGTVLIGGLLSTFHVYADFSAYCDMGRGLAHCFDIRLSVNFWPFYYAKEPADFWRRWNITLGAWIRDYVTLPAMMHFGRKLNLYCILFVSFFLMGLWHGLYWNWFLFGGLNGALVAMYALVQKKFGEDRPAVKLFGRLLVLILFVGNGLLSQVGTKDRLIWLGENLTFAHGWGNSLTLKSLLLFTMPLLAPLLLMDFFQERKHDLDVYLRLPIFTKWLFVSLCFALGIMLTRSEMNPFLYLNF